MRDCKAIAASLRVAVCLEILGTAFQPASVLRSRCLLLCPNHGLIYTDPPLFFAQPLKAEHVWMSVRCRALHDVLRSNREESGGMKFGSAGRVRVGQL